MTCSTTCAARACSTGSRSPTRSRRRCGARASAARPRRASGSGGSFRRSTALRWRPRSGSRARAARAAAVRGAAPRHGAAAGRSRGTRCSRAVDAAARARRARGARRAGAAGPSCSSCSTASRSCPSPALARERCCWPSRSRSGPGASGGVRLRPGRRRVSACRRGRAVSDRRASPRARARVRAAPQGRRAGRRPRALPVLCVRLARDASRSCSAIAAPMRRATSRCPRRSSPI